MEVCDLRNVSLVNLLCDVAVKQVILDFWSPTKCLRSTFLQNHQSYDPSWPVISPPRSRPPRGVKGGQWAIKVIRHVSYGCQPRTICSSQTYQLLLLYQSSIYDPANQPLTWTVSRSLYYWPPESHRLFNLSLLFCFLACCGAFFFLSLSCSWAPPHLPCITFVSPALIPVSFLSAPSLLSRFLHSFSTCPSSPR